MTLLLPKIKVKYFGRLSLSEGILSPRTRLKVGKVLPILILTSHILVVLLNTPKMTSNPGLVDTVCLSDKQIP